MRKPIVKIFINGAAVPVQKSGNTNILLLAAIIFMSAAINRRITDLERRIFNGETR